MFKLSNISKFPTTHCFPQALRSLSGWEVVGKNMETIKSQETGMRMSLGKTAGEPEEEIRARMERLRESLAGKEEGTIITTVGKD